ATLDDSMFLIENKKYYFSVNRIYYASFYMLSALAIKFDFNTSKHTQLIGWFNKNFVASNKIEVEHGKAVMQLFELRMKADYDVYATFTKEQTIELYEKCKKLIIRIEEIIY
ncbi:MAG: HEPN domain-containing protein, partial [Spirochaetales bacterium]|nr:HEPN domain-containing protein [Spirochaetales bacterium]